MLVENISDLVIFATVVKFGSLSAAGRELGFSNAVVSKRVQRLETQLSVRLLSRSTRRLRLTEEGTHYHDYCVRILAELDEIETLISSGQAQPKGTLRVTVPAAFGRLHIAPLIPVLLKRYTQLRVSLHLSDDIVDIIEDGYDVAVRIGDMKDSNLVSRHLGVDRRKVVATPAYLSRHGIPQTPEDLMDHNALVFANPVPMDHWQFVNAVGQPCAVKVSGNFDTNNCDALRAAIFADAGIALRPTWDVWQDLKAGTLQVVLPDYHHPFCNIQAVYPSRRYLSQKVRVFIDLLSETFGDKPYWDGQ